jgi:hypothetical protein
VKSLLVLAVGAAVIAACGSDPSPPPLRTPPPPPTVCTLKRPASCPGTAPNFEKDVLPILKRSCLGCHSGDGMASDGHDFSKMDVLLAQKSRMGVQVAACAMPPRQVKFATTDANVLLNWIACSGDEK